MDTETLSKIVETINNLNVDLSSGTVEMFGGEIMKLMWFKEILSGFMSIMLLGALVILFIMVIKALLNTK